jgi:hypothetical protein
MQRGEQVQKLLPQSAEMAQRHIGGLTHIAAYLPKPKQTESN